jgi:hypothetical protein
VRPRGFALRELGLTLLLLAVVIVGAVRLIDLRTKLLAVEKDEPLGSVLEAAARALERDVRVAGRGGVSREEAIRPVADDSGADASRYVDVKGASVAVRAGTDQVGLRGIMRTPPLGVRPAAPGSIGADPSAVWLTAGPLPEGEGASRADEPRAVAAVLGAATPRAKRFFLVADREGRAAVARVRDWRSPGEAGAALAIRLDFTDPEARRLNPRGESEAARALGEPATGGLLDDVVWFVAQGPPGRYPDYEPVNDPPSMRFPHPFLALAEFAGNGRWEVLHVGEDIEDFQAVWGPGSVKFGWTAKAESRFTRADGPRPPLEFPPLLNAPAPGSVRGAGPVGWDPDESRRIPFERASKEIVLNRDGGEARGPRGAPPRVK